MAGTFDFCRNSSKCYNYAPFVSEIIKYVLIRIILGFGSNLPPSNKKSDSNVPLQIFGFKSNKLDLCTFVANLALSRLRAFGGGLLAKIGGGGTKTF